ncbi:MAG TPA: sensor domain-containing diguanylate cyclase, partial [Rhodocyclaceae bacterium]|nr:sensor domain-containing diguanylate cyclase [Rhodocyclaceae bacterium]
EMRSQTGETFWVLLSSRIIEFGGDNVIYSVTSNITRMKLAEDALRLSEQKLRDLLEIAPSAIFIIGVDDGRVLFHNRLARVLSGVEEGSLIGLRAPDFFADPLDRALLIEAIQRDGPVKERELRIRTAPGETHWFHVSATLVEYEGQTAMFCAMLDIDERRQTEKQLELARSETESANRELRMVNMELEQLASTDRLTNAFNRRHFEEVALREMSRARRYSLPLTLIMIDLDHFKSINDDFGHAAGDHVLVELTQLVRTHLRSSDVLARWGGEEFVILATSTALEEVTMLAEKLRDLFEHHEFADLRPLTFSAGVTSLSFRDTLDTFIRRADKALYKAKAEGRNRVVSLGAEALA